MWTLQWPPVNSGYRTCGVDPCRNWTLTGTTLSSLKRTIDTFQTIRSPLQRLMEKCANVFKFDKRVRRDTPRFLDKMKNFALLARHKSRRLKGLGNKTEIVLTSGFLRLRVSRLSLLSSPWPAYSIPLAVSGKLFQGNARWPRQCNSTSIYIQKSPVV